MKKIFFIAAVLMITALTTVSCEAEPLTDENTTQFEEEATGRRRGSTGSDRRGSGY